MYILSHACVQKMSTSTPLPLAVNSYETLTMSIRQCLHCFNETFSISVFPTTQTIWRTKVSAISVTVAKGSRIAAFEEHCSRAFEVQVRMRSKNKTRIMYDKENCVPGL